LAVSPDGEWVIVYSFDDVGPAMVAVPVQGGAAKKICAQGCQSAWSSDGRFFYVTIPGQKTLVIPVPAGKSLPDLPASGSSATNAAELPGASQIEHGFITPGANPSEYIFLKTDLQRNLFRIPLH
jgi:hypothetical protein